MKKVLLTIPVLAIALISVYYVKNIYYPVSTAPEVLSDSFINDRSENVIQVKNNNETSQSSGEENINESSLAVESNSTAVPEANTAEGMSSDFKALDLSNQRIVAFYGNFYSKGMGILGELNQDELLNKLITVSSEWQVADPEKQVVPAIHYIASTAQSNPMSDGTYRLRMPAAEIIKAAAMSQNVNGITILDLQIGQANLMAEIAAIEKYLLLPNVHLGIDPEFKMRPGDIPGQVIGTISAIEVNQIVNYLDNLVITNSLVPKILVLHTFKNTMISELNDIESTDNVSVIIEMDGWGSPELKKNTYLNTITYQGVEYAGFKIFYKNDLRPPSTRLITPAEILQLNPTPVYIQYQ